MSFPLTRPTELEHEFAAIFVEKNWCALARFAYPMYRRHGRGCLSYNAEGQPPSASGLLYRHRCAYVSLEGCRAQQAELQLWGLDLERLVGQYDPERSVVVALARPFSAIDRHARQVLGEPLPESEAVPLVTAGVYTFLPPPPVCLARAVN